MSGRDVWLRSIAAVGWLLGQVLAAGGQVDEALAVLDQSAAAFEKMKMGEQAAQVRELQKKIKLKSLGGIRTWR